MKVITRKVAKRYIRRFGGKIASLTLMTPDGLFDTLRDKDGYRIAVISN